MSEDSEKGFFGQLMDSIKGIAIGAVLIVICCGAFIWNEKRSVDVYNTLQEGRGLVVSVKSDKVDKGNDGKLIHTSGDVALTAVADKQFGIETKGLKLMRNVEMYQWKEKMVSKKDDKGKSKKKPEYSKVWSSTLIDSSRFKKKKSKSGKSRINPSKMPYEEATFVGDGAKLGAFALSESVIKKLNNSSELAYTDEFAKNSKVSGGKVDGGGYYIGKDSSDPKIGDVKIDWRVVAPKKASVVAKQTKGSFAPMKIKSTGRDLIEVKEGIMNADEMFTAAEESNVMVTWLIRVLGFVFMFIGFRLVFGPLTFVADKIPLVGGLLEGGISLFAGLLAFAVSMGFIAIGWIIARPLLGGVLCILSLGALGAMVFLGMQMAKKKAAAAAA